MSEDTTSFITALTVPTPGDAVTAEERGMVVAADKLARAMLPITSDETALEARGTLEEIHEFRKDLENRRVANKDIVLRAGRQIDAAYKPYITVLDFAVTSVKARLTGWAQKVEAERKRAEDEAERIAASEQRDVAPITREVVAAQTSAKVVGKMREFKDVIIADPALIPREYLVPDMAKIRAAALADVAIPGVQVKIEKRVIA